ncbi:MAG: YkgJ family cysteine cluster protein [Firmicutes bacterium]|nr:YkgJ family cysteine cluster protein [Bacillota bacterium]
MVFDFQKGVLEKLQTDTLEELNPEHAFHFSCCDECMGRCCRKITILLEPWDIEVMARHLEMPGQQFFTTYCTMELDRQTGWPAVWLTHAADGPCAFMLPDGKCSIYPARSGNCRTFPLGRAVRYVKEDSLGQPSRDERLFMVERMQFCLGDRDGKSWTVQEWLDDADVLTWYRMSDQYTELVDYAMRELSVRQWMNDSVLRMVIPFLYAPDILRKRLGAAVDEVSHEEFHRRRMAAVKMILTDLAAGFGCGPRAGKGAAVNSGSLMERVGSVLAGGK